MAYWRASIDMMWLSITDIYSRSEIPIYLLIIKRLINWYIYSKLWMISSLKTLLYVVSNDMDKNSSPNWLTYLLVGFNLVHALFLLLSNITFTALLRPEDEWTLYSSIAPESLNYFWAECFLSNVWFFMMLVMTRDHIYLL